MYYIFHFLFFQAFIFAQFAIPTRLQIQLTEQVLELRLQLQMVAMPLQMDQLQTIITITFTSNETTSNFIISDIGAVGGSIAHLQDRRHSNVTPSAN